MPMLYALGQHGALLAMQARLGVGEYVFDFLDDIHTVTGPASQREWMWRMLSLRRSCGPMPASTCTMEKRKSGTEGVLSRVVLRP